MKIILICLITVIFGLSLDIKSIGAKELSIQWFGQACFSIVTPSGTTIITDPIDFSSRNIPYVVSKDITPDIVTVSHEHGDHNAVQAVSGNPTVIRGLTDAGKAYADVNQEVKGIKLYTVNTYHDKEEGKQRGLNAIFVLEFDNLRLAHFGDLGHMLSDEQINAIGPIDILLIPTGGGPTIDAKEASELVAKINPRLLVIPMHFKTDVVTFMPNSAEDFVGGKQNVKHMDGNRYVLNLSPPPSQLEYVVLNYK